MPIYEYVCTACGHPVEVMHSFTAPGPERCELCGAPMRKALSTPAIVFKGSGWAKKDHRDKVHAASKPAVTPDAGATNAGSGAPPSVDGGSMPAAGAEAPVAASTPAAAPTGAAAASTSPAAGTTSTPARTTSSSPV